MSREGGPPAGLNEGQARAARHLGRPLLIDAGAGSGKTRTLTQRIVCALTPGAVPGWVPASVDEVLAITFTEKAAGEIGERVRQALRKEGRTEDARRLDAAWLSTIHGLCSRLLRKHALHAGIDPAFRVLDGVEAHRLKERAFAEAAAEAMESSAAGEELFGEYGFEAVAGVVESLRRELHTRGSWPSALELEPVRDAARIRRDAAAFFERMRDAWDACASTTATADAQRDACARTTAALARIEDGSPPAMLAAQVWAALDAHPKPPAKLKGAEEVIGEMGPGRTRLLRQAAGAATAPMAAALRGLVAAHSERYAAAKRAAGGLDFDDLQVEALRLLRSRPEVADGLRRQFRLVMVDEFQDTDALQLALVRALAGEDLCTVGDERQSIYRFRGADVAVYREHVRAMTEAGALSVPLTENYRSHPDILSFVNAAFGSSALFGGTFLPLRAMRDESARAAFPSEARVRVALVLRKGNGSTAAREARLVAERFAELRDAGVPTGSMAVLLRTYRHADEFASALRSRGIPALIVGGSRFLERPEVRTLRALCRALANVHDDEALVQLLAAPVGGVSDDALWLLRNDAETGLARRGSLADAIVSPAAVLADADSSEARRLLEVLERARARLGRMPLSEILLRAVEESAWDLKLLAEGDAGRHAYANVLKLARLADAFEASGGAGPAGFVEHLETKEASGDRDAPATLADESSPCVRIMSVHASKGLEFAVVAMPQLGDGPRGDRGAVRWSADGDRIRLALALPSARCAAAGSKSNATEWFSEFDAADAAAEEDEAKRLFYVACTRAEEMLLLTGATNLAEEPVKGAPLGWLLSAVEEARERGEAIPIEWERVDVAEEEVPAWDAGEADEAEDGRDAAFWPPAPPCEPQAKRAPAPDRLSYSDIALYRRCGLRFFCEKVLRVGVPGEAGEKAKSFGSAVHAALQLAVGGAVAPDDERLTALGRSFGIAEEDGPRLREAVRTFLASRLASELASLRRVRTEVPFAVPVGRQGFLLAGTIDAYAREGDRGLIVDYKTGTAGTEADLRDAFALQAACYALVALRDGCERVRVAFARLEVAEDGEPQAVEYEFDAGDAGAIEAELLADHARMSAGEYDPLPGRDRRVCTACPAATKICPLRES